MKLSLKSASLLATLAIASTVGSQISYAVVDATEDGAATHLDSTGKVTVEDATDTNPPGEDGNGTIVDPEKPGTSDPKDPNDVNENKKPGTLKIERVSNLNFGTIAPSTTDVVVPAAPLALADGTTRGAVVQFADVRTDVYGYTVQVKMQKQFTKTESGKADRVLKGSTITFNNGFVRSEIASENNMPTASNLSNIVVGEDKDAVEIVKASNSSTDEQGKGRYVLEFGQSPEFDATALGDIQTIGTGTKDTAKDAVKLTVPASTASNMQKGTYTSTVRWSIAAIPGADA